MLTFKGLVIVMVSTVVGWAILSSLITAKNKIKYVEMIFDET